MASTDTLATSSLRFVAGIVAEPPTRDSLRESMLLDVLHEQTISRPLAHDDLDQRRRIAAPLPP